MVRITGNRETAEELTLDVFHDVWRRASTYDVKGGSVVGWIMNQARSRAIDRVRFDHRKKRVTPPYAETGSAESASAYAEEDCDQTSWSPTVRRAASAICSASTSRPRSRRISASRRSVSTR